MSTNESLEKSEKEAIERTLNVRERYTFLLTVFSGSALVFTGRPILELREFVWFMFIGWGFLFLSFFIGFKSIFTYLLFLDERITFYRSLQKSTDPSANSEIKAGKQEEIYDNLNTYFMKHAELLECQLVLFLGGIIIYSIFIIYNVVHL